MTNTLNPNSRAALTIARDIIRDRRMNPTFTPDALMIERRIRDYRAAHPDLTIDIDRTTTLINFAIA